MKEKKEQKKPKKNKEELNEIRMRYQRSEFIEFAPLGFKEMNAIQNRLVIKKKQKESVVQGAPTKIKTNSKLDDEKVQRIKKNMEKNGDCSLRKFVFAHQKELNFCSYEKVFYSIKEQEVVELLWNKGFINLTESVIFENLVETIVRRRYYVNFKMKDKFIEYLNEFVLADFKKNRKELKRKAAIRRKQRKQKALELAKIKKAEEKKKKERAKKAAAKKPKKGMKKKNWDNVKVKGRTVKKKEPVATIIDDKK